MANLGSLLFFFLFYFAEICCLSCTKKAPCCCDRLQSCAGNRLNLIFCNGLLTVIDGTFLVICITSAINIQQVARGNIEIGGSFWIAVLALAVYTSSVLFVAVFFCRNAAKLDEDKNIKKCGYVYESLNYKIRGPSTLAYPIVSQLRIMAFVYTLMYLSDHFIVQATLIILGTYITASFLGNSTHSLSQISLNYTTIMSEFVIVAVIDLLLVATDPGLDIEAHGYIGKILIAVLGLTIFASQGQLLVESILTLKNRMRLYFLRKAHRKELAERQQS